MEELESVELKSLSLWCARTCIGVLLSARLTLRVLEERFQLRVDPCLGNDLYDLHDVSCHKRKVVVTKPSWHYELMSFGAHGQDGARSGADYVLGNAANEDMSEARATVRGEDNEINRLRAGVADDLHFGRPFDDGLDDLSTGRPLRI